jgi:hypothetical protein
MNDLKVIFKILISTAKKFIVKVLNKNNNQLS